MKNFAKKNAKFNDDDDAADEDGNASTETDEYVLLLLLFSVCGPVCTGGFKAALNLQREKEKEESLVHTGRINNLYCRCC